jgi:hypothetical protein
MVPIVDEPAEPWGLQEAVEVLLRERALLQHMRRHALKRADYFKLDRMRGEYLQVMADAQANSATAEPSRFFRRAA